MVRCILIAVLFSYVCQAQEAAYPTRMDFAFSYEYKGVPIELKGYLDRNNKRKRFWKIHFKAKALIDGKEKTCTASKRERKFPRRPNVNKKRGYRIIRYWFTETCWKNYKIKFIFDVPMTLGERLFFFNENRGGLNKASKNFGDIGFIESPYPEVLFIAINEASVFKSKEQVWDASLVKGHYRISEKEREALQGVRERFETKMDRLK